MRESWSRSWWNTSPKGPRSPNFTNRAK
jgi:hypothetical protein